MLEELIKKLIAALEENTAALKAAGSAAPAEKKEKKEKTKDKEPEAPQGPTLQDFRDLAGKIVDLNQGKKLEELAKEHGLARVSAAHGTDKAAVVYAALEKIYAAANV